MEYAQRKPLRLPDYNYGTNGYYFVTICTQKKHYLFAMQRYASMETNPCVPQPSVGWDPCVPPQRATNIAEKWIQRISNKFPNCHIDKYVIMPNHIHMIVVINRAVGHVGPTLPDIIQWYKTMVTNEYIRDVKAGYLPPFDKKIWQRSYYDHVIRNESDYLTIWQYVDTNPIKWKTDEFYTTEEIQ